jgi:GNAT superfamily N-acetyltransferase
MESALGTIFAVDRQLISDRTYFVVESEGQIVGCGGWSKRAAGYGGDHSRPEPDPILDPRCDAARIRAFFVHPNRARQRIGSSILLASEQASIAAGFSTAELVATLAGQPLYAAFGYSAVERYEIPMQNGLTLPVVRMTKNFRADGGCNR